MVTTMTMNAQQLGYVLSHLNGAIASLEYARHMADDGGDDPVDVVTRSRIDDMLGDAVAAKLRLEQVKRERTTP